VNDLTANKSAFVGTGTVNTNHCAELLVYALSKLTDADGTAAAVAPDPVDAPAETVAATPVTFLIEYPKRPAP
jgi:hypothetical protein